MAWVNFNGEFLQDDKPFLYPSNRSFRFGDGLFESSRIISGRINFFKYHFQRLLKGMKILGIESQANFTQEYLEGLVIQLLEKNNFENARLRITVFRNGGGLYNPVDNHGNFIIELVQVKDSRYVLNVNGLSIESFEGIRKPVNILSGIKTANALIYVLAAMHKTTINADDCIILNEYDNVCEAVSSSIFMVKDKVIYTPALTEGCVEGVMRGQIILLAKERGQELREEKISLNDLLAADEIFISNAANGIQWVGAFRQKRYYNDLSKSFTEALNLKTGIVL